jgi:hypothetical protein
MTRLLLIFYLCLFASISIGQDLEKTDTLEANNKKLRNRIITLATLDVASLAILSEAWYKDQFRSSFHFFNDFPEWLQADKAGHFYCSYQLSKAGILSLKRWGMSDKKANLWGSVAGFLLIS